MRPVIKARRAEFVRRADLIGGDNRRNLKADELADREKEWQTAGIDQNWYLIRKKRSPQRR